MARKRRFKYISLVAITAGALSLLSLAGALSTSSHLANELATKNTATMVAGGLKSEVKTLQATVYDYSIWQAAYENAVARDLDWIYDNMSSGAGTGLFDVMEVYWPTDGAIVGWNADGEDAPQSSILPTALVERAYNDLSMQSDFDEANFAYNVMIDGQLAMVVVSRIEPEDYPADAVSSDFPLNFMISLWDDDAVAELGKTYLLNGLTLANSVPEGMSFIPVTDFNGDVVRNVTWAPPNPGAKLLKAQLPLLALSILIIISFFMYVGRIAQGIADKLKLTARKATKLAKTDFLTNLPNRLAYHEHMKKVVDNSTSEVALMIADINSFKLVNDTHGHVAGDTLILGIAQRIQNTMQNEIFVARVGGDEFCFVLSGKNAAERLTGAADALRSALEPAFYLEGKPFFLTMSMGLSVRKEGDTISQDEFMRQADAAMYTSKSNAAHMLVRYEASVDPDRIKGVKLEAELRAALKHPEQFTLKYQPIVNSGDCKVDIAEALVRWSSPSLGAVSPADFIPIAESTGLIRHITSMVLDMVCKDLVSEKNMKVSINISPVEISDPNFHDDLAGKVQQYGIKPDRIIIELTEGVLVENPRGLAVSLQKLRLMGHQIALDDFGTGYSSIGYLRQMEFTLLKVDKSLIDGVTRDKRAREVLLATLSLAKAIGMRVLAEGVETKAQAKLLSEMGFDFQQGFNFSAGLQFGELMDYANNKEIAFVACKNAMKVA